MNEKIKGFGDKVKEQVGKLNKKTRNLIIIALIVLVIAAVVIVVVLNNQPYAVLFTDMNSEEFSSVLSYLEQNGVRNYRIQDNDTVLVPRDQESRLKAQLLMAGYPNTGFSYESYYEHVGALSTESERNRTYFMALEEKMGAVIRCLDGVQEAVVTIAQGEDRSYVLDSGNVVNASASVIVTMKNGASLNEDTANAIRRLVARAVQGLEIESVEIVDNIGNTYSSSTSGAGAAKDATQLKLQLEESANNRVRTEVMRALKKMFGEENVDVGVHCTVEIDQGVSESTTYELPDWAADGSTNGEGIIGSKVYNDLVVLDEGEGAGGTVGTTTNADLPTYIEDTMQVDGTERRIETNGQKDYLVDTYKKKIEHTAGYITDCTVAVTINSTTAGSVNIPAMRDHVAKAAGISALTTETMTADEYLASKISVVTMPFFVPGTDGQDGNTPTEPVIPQWAIYAAIAGAVLFVILLILIIVLRKRSKKKKAAALAALAEENQQAVLDGLLAAAAEKEPTGADVMSMETEKSMELRKEIRKFADSNPEIAAQMVKALLKGGDERA